MFIFLKQCIDEIPALRQIIEFMMSQTLAVVPVLHRSFKIIDNLMQCRTVVFVNSQKSVSLLLFVSVRVYGFVEGLSFKGSQVFSEKHLRDTKLTDSVMPIFLTYLSLFLVDDNKMQTGWKI